MHSMTTDPLGSVVASGAGMHPAQVGPRAETDLQLICL